MVGGSSSSPSDVLCVDSQEVEGMMGWGGLGALFKGKCLFFER